MSLSQLMNGRMKSYSIFLFILLRKKSTRDKLEKLRFNDTGVQHVLDFSNLPLCDFIYNRLLVGLQQAEICLFTEFAIALAHFMEAR